MQMPDIDTGVCMRKQGSAAREACRIWAQVSTYSQSSAAKMTTTNRCLITSKGPNPVQPPTPATCMSMVSRASGVVVDRPVPAPAPPPPPPSAFLRRRARRARERVSHSWRDMELCPLARASWKGFRPLWLRTRLRSSPAPHHTLMMKFHQRQLFCFLHVATNL